MYITHVCSYIYIYVYTYIHMHIHSWLLFAVCRFSDHFLFSSCLNYVQTYCSAAFVIVLVTGLEDPLAQSNFHKQRVSTSLNAKPLHTLHNRHVNKALHGRRLQTQSSSPAIQALDPCATPQVQSHSSVTPFTQAP